MFQPENDIERALMRASAESAERPDFMRALMDAEIFVLLVPETGALVPGTDGKATVSQGSRLTMVTVTRGEKELLPFFTTPSRARDFFTGEHIVAPDKTRDLFKRAHNAAFVLNPGSDYGKEFTPDEVQRLLAGQFDDGPQTTVIEKPEQVLLAHPKEIPGALIAALGRELGALKTVRGAWLMLAMRSGASDQTWMLGIDHNGEWQDVRAAIGRAMVGNVLNGRLLDAMPLSDSSFSSTLRTGIPVTAEKRGFLSKLFR
jgi:hypothetical protein